MAQFPPRTPPPTLLGMSTEENITWLNAHDWAYKCIVAALERARAASYQLPADFETWFSYRWPWTSHASWLNHQRIVIDSLTKMANRMNSSSVVYEKVNDAPNCEVSGGEDRAAITYLNGGRKIGLCPKAFNVHALRFAYWDSEEWARALILVHETYHAAVNIDATDGGTSDSYYLYSICKNLSCFNSDLAVKNAQNFAFYVMGSYWQRPTTVPDWLPDYGIWNLQTPGANWGSSSGGVAAAAGARNALMFVYQDPEAEGGRLWHRVMALEGGRPVSRLAKALPSRVTPRSDCVSLVKPTLVADGLDFYCAYIEKESGKVVAVKANLRPDSGNDIAVNYLWEDLNMTVDASDNPLIHGNSIPSPSPAFAVYRPSQKNVSSGLYCVYSNRSGELRCRALLEEKWARWVNVPFDRPRGSMISASMLVFNDQLRCFYHEGSTSKFTLLNYIPASKAGNFHDAAAGTWEEDRHPVPDLAAENIVLGQFKTPSGPRLVALGNKSGQIGNLRYSLYCETTGWSPVTMMTTLASAGRVGLAEFDSGLHLFYRNPNGSIESRFARA